MRSGTLTEADALGLRADDERHGESYPRADLTGRDLTGIAFRGCALTGQTWTDTLLQGAELVDCRLVDSFATTLLGGQTTWRRVLVQRPRWGSAELVDSGLTSVHLRDGKIDYLNARQSRWTDVLIEDCTIGTLDLGGWVGSRVSLLRCRIGTLDVGSARFEDVDLRTSQLGVINGIDGLQGVTIDESQLMELAPLLARHLGIRVE
jgi:uncharacterized protein YjbI with pentapeptide repeats